MKRLLFILLLALVATSANAQNAQSTQNSPSEQDEQTTYIFLRGVQEMLGGDAETAAAVFLSILQKQPQHTPSNYYLARILHNEDMPTDALKYATRATLGDSTNYDLLWLKASLEVETDQLEKALVTTRKIRHLRPDDPQHYTVEIAMLSELRQFPEILALCDSAIQKFGLSTKLIDRKYEALIELDSLPSAMRLMMAATTIHPTEPLYQARLGTLLMVLGHPQQATQTFQEMVRQNPQSLDVLNWALNFYQASENTTEMLNTIMQLMANAQMGLSEKIALFKTHFLIPDHYADHHRKIQQIITTLLLSESSSIEVKLLNARYLYYTMEPEKAIAQFQEILQEDPTCEQAYTELSQVLYIEKQLAELLETARRYAENIEGTSPRVNLIAVLSLLYEYDEALDEVANLLKVKELTDSTRSEILTLQGDIHHQNQEPKKSYKSYQKALKLNPQNATALNNYAYFITLDPNYTQKQLQKALEMANQACEITPGSPTFLDTKAAVLVELGQLSDAQLIMSHVMKIDPNPSHEIITRYADILYLLGDKLVAKRYWNQALKAGADPIEIQNRLQKIN